MTRDARGRFCTVPDLILDAACREAVARLRDDPRLGVLAAGDVLLHAGLTAELLAECRDRAGEGAGS